MTEVRTARTRAPQVAVRCLVARDIPQVLEIASRNQPALMTHLLRAALRSRDGWTFVAESGRQVAGFLACTWARLPDPAIAADGRLPRRIFRWLSWRRRPHLLFVSFLQTGVAPGADAAEVERSLLEQLERRLAQSGDEAQVVVPETDLPAQLFLRAAGFRARRVVRGHYGDEDGYLLVRRPR